MASRNARPNGKSNSRTTNGVGLATVARDRRFVRRSEQGDDRPWVVGRSSIHNRGVFARRPVRAGERIIDYVGELITKSEADRRGEVAASRARRTGGGAVYIFNLNKKFDIDGAFPWNTARLINHSCAPNCDVEIVKGRIWISALRDIDEGEELSFNYGFDLDDYESHPCRCGAESCIGYILGEEFWPDLQKKNQKRATTARRNGSGGVPRPQRGAKGERG
jgi:SET domain-containing protein